MGDTVYVGVCARAALAQAAAARRLVGPVRAGRDAEALHDLRVATRRLRAALGLLESDGVPEARPWRRELRRVTRALGEARDLDVRIDFLRRFAARLRGSSGAGLRPLLAGLRRRRASAQRDVDVALRRLLVRGTLEEILRRAGTWAEGAAGDGAAVATDRRPPATPGPAGRALLDRLHAVRALGPFVFRAEAAARHHRLRIAAKRLRYAMEALRPLFGAPLEERLAEVKALQGILGALHDCDVWIASLPNSPGGPAGPTALRLDRERRRRARHRRLVAWWEAHAGTWEAIRGLAGPAGAPATPLAPVVVALIGDVHANRHALEAVLADIDRRNIRETWCAGDVVGYGASPREAVEILRRRAIPCVAGNLDRKLFRAAGPGAPRKDGPPSLKRLTHLWTWDRLGPAARRWLRDLPDALRFDRAGREILVVHGSPASDEEYIAAETGRKRLRELARLARADVVVAGHAHVPCVERAAGTWFVNTGSVGRPEGAPDRACYAILTLTPEALDIRHVEVPYDVDGAVAAVHEAGLPDAYARMIRTGRTLDEVLEGATGARAEAAPGGASRGARKTARTSQPLAKSDDPAPPPASPGPTVQ
jgi:CHAD domain-containing protein/predicted phosphodiesterase